MASIARSLRPLSSAALTAVAAGRASAVRPSRQSVASISTATSSGVMSSSNRSRKMGMPLLLQRAFSATRIAPEKRYTKDHEWIDLPDAAKDSSSASTQPIVATIGISSYASHALGDVVYVELPTTGSSFSGGDALGAVESVKSASDINAPVACTVVEVNTELEETPALVNKGSEDGGAGGGWVARVEVAEEGVAEARGLMSGEEYRNFTAEEK